ncbi:hypothetical protein BDM02DRAFT_3108906 [Thelephora ganbajun]|uniref:Uncharacterized protein n=1 Tax=Thelephora ganbajun TaxID=370292 RepID=A0ACB6ZSM5_THEGA|nr:hypothetical protein BDM02DRAFT_3108906 [Thelephora ganbajun]
MKGGIHDAFVVFDWFWNPRRLTAKRQMVFKSQGTGGRDSPHVPVAQPVSHLQWRLFRLHLMNSGDSRRRTFLVGFVTRKELSKRAQIEFDHFFRIMESSLSLVDHPIQTFNVGSTIQRATEIRFVIQGKPLGLRRGGKSVTPMSWKPNGKD